MDIFSFFKRSCIVFLLPILFACGGDVDDYGNGDSTAPNISLFESSYDFSGIVLDNSSDKTFLITNNGTESLTIGSISPPIAPFSILADTCSNKTLAVDKTCSVSIRFSPIIQAVFADTVSIPSNDPGGTVTIGLSGEGYGLNVWINKIETSGCDVTVDVTATSPLIDGVLDTLTEQDFELYENGEPISGIDVFQKVIPSPVSVVLAIDWSGSEMGVIETIKAAASAFVDSLNPATDEAAACKFDGDIEYNPPAPGPPYFHIGDYTTLKTYIGNDFTGSDGTDLYDAVYDSITRAAEGINETKAVVVLSDGVNVDSGDPTPDATLAQVIAHATTQAIPVFTIYYRDPDFQGGGYGNPEVMEQLADETGGKYHDGTVVDLADVYQQISNILTSKYLITYESLNCTGDVSLDVLADYYWDPPGEHLYGQDSGTITLP